MPSNNEVPRGFKILSEFPVLVIEYQERESLYPITVFLNIIVLFLALLAFVVVFWLSIEPLSLSLNRIEQPDFGQFQNGGRLNFDENRFPVSGLIGIIFPLGFLLLITYQVIWGLLGISRYMAFPQKLIVKHQLLGISQTFSIPRNSLLYFKLYKIRVKYRTKGWTLKAITHPQNLLLLFRPEIPVMSTKPFKYSYWLGMVLADFYQVELQYSQSKSIE